MPETLQPESFKGLFGGPFTITICFLSQLRYEKTVTPHVSATVAVRSSSRALICWGLVSKASDT